MEHQSTMYVVRQRWQGFKDNDRNFVAAFFHMCTVALVCTSLAALGWFRLRGAPCSPHLAVYQFFSYGHFSMDSNPSIPEIVSSKAVTSPLISQYHSSTGGFLNQLEKSICLFKFIHSFELCHSRSCWLNESGDTPLLPDSIERPSWIYAGYLGCFKANVADCETSFTSKHPCWY